MGYLKFKINYWTKKIDADNDAEQAKRVLDKIGNWKKVCDGVLSKLRNTKTRYCVATDICNKISNEEQKWNLNPNVFCFENRVIDITTGKKVVADPLDFINMSCGYDYNDKYSLDLVTELETLITSIQPEKKLKNYLMQVLSTSLMSEQIQAFFILTGKGGNGKSVLVELMVEMLGDYAYNLPSGFISKTIKEGGNPEASGMDCKRLVIVSEPESKDPICCATVKKITGDTKINVRPLYSNQTGIDLKCTVIMICNEKPALDEVNDAVSRRMRAGVIPFGEKFVSKNEFDGTSDEEKKQFNMKLGDVKYVSQKFKTEYKQALFMILLPYFRHYQKTLFSDAPPIVIKESKAYIKGCDNICEWFEENYEPSDDSMVFVDDLFNNYSSTNEFYQLSKEDKRKYGTAKKFKDILQGNLFIRKYYKEANQYWNKKKQSKPFIAGWRKTVLVTEDCDVDSDTTTVVN
jgi:P4 family phage/plasmid primase-like protien